MKQPIFVVILSLSSLAVGTSACQNYKLKRAADDHSQRQLETEHDDLVHVLTEKAPTSKWSDQQLDGYDQAISKLERLRIQLAEQDNHALAEKLEDSEVIVKESRKTLAAVRAEKAKFLSGHDAVLLWQKVNDRVQSIFAEMELLLSQIRAPRSFNSTLTSKNSKRFAVSLPNNRRS